MKTIRTPAFVNTSAGRQYLLAAALVCALGLGTTVAQAADALPSWNEGKTKQAVVDFVKRVTTAGAADFVPGPERIAVFDNDGTLWAEQPIYFQLAFALDRVKALAPQPNSSIGRLDKGLDEAKAKAWTVVDMKRDWKVVFPFEKK